MVHRRKHHGFPNRPAAHRGIADVGDDNARFAVDPFVQGRAGGNIGRSADDGVVGHDPKGGKEGVHGAAHAFVETGGAAKNLGQGAVEGVVNGQPFDAAVGADFFHHPQRRAIQVGFHNFQQVGIAQFLNGGEAFGQDFAVAAVGAENVIFRGQVIRLPHRGGFLPDGEVGRAKVVVLDALIGSLPFDAVQHGLKFADEGHIAVNPHQVVGAVFLGLGGGVGLIGVQRYLRGNQHAGFAGFYRVDGN